MKIRHLKRASIARTLKRIRHAPVRQALMERGRRASYRGAALMMRNRRREKRQFRPVFMFYGGDRLPLSAIDIMAQRTKAAGLKPLNFNRFVLGDFLA